ncbi:MAG: cation-translocating P-type ATPase, partial [Alistipes sp.]|nr:cation-translocating P-type ATPase [Alistipes sp.]
VRRMHACEPMGAVTVICTDKTGTLTRNRMRVENMYISPGVAAEELAAAVAVNTTAFLSHEAEPIGNPTEGALLLWMHDAGYDYRAIRDAAATVDRMTFSTERKYMATIVDTPQGRMIAVKGAPEIVAALCSDVDAAQTGEVLGRYQSRAMRTLAIACARTEAATCGEALAGGGLALIALAGISDPVRDEVPAAVAKCLGAGIAVKIVTGDNMATATEIARRIGLWDDSCDSATDRITGPEFAALSDEEALARVGRIRIMSRARPLDKQRMVRLLQRSGEVVAVTGDGTNDAPALNFANVGLSMGSGTSVAKDASDITLLDDSFASIATAVMWGRSLYRNIQRFVLFQLTINFAAIVTVFVGAVAGTELPLTVVQILWVNLIMDTFAAMAMASLPPNEEVMRDRPRPRDEFIITPAMARTIAVCGSVFIVVMLAMLFGWMYRGGVPTTAQLTVFFSTFVFLQVWNLLNAKGFETRHCVFSDLGRTRTFTAILLAIAAGQVAIVELGGEVFRTVPLPVGTWAAIVAATSLIALGGEAVRLYRRGRRRIGNKR